VGDQRVESVLEGEEPKDVQESYRTKKPSDGVTRTAGGDQSAYGGKS
jgi:hypothetical protein